ncbi:hypothetical protein GPL06_03190 [Bacteroides salyersiae]|nr:hypothetical protein [Bacteroides salyersiae]
MPHFFGHEKGAFTGADAAKTGFLQEANDGTLFLDEVGNLPIETQQMLLRAIQEKRYRPFGAKADRKFNARIIAATNENLNIAGTEKRFRQDLLYRLQDFTITVPPLRECQDEYCHWLSSFGASQQRIKPSDTRLWQLRTYCDTFQQVVGQCP